MRVLVVSSEPRRFPDPVIVGARYFVIRTTATSDTSYFTAVRDEWLRGLTFGINEQDITPRRRTWNTLSTCPADWCAAPYPYLDRPRQFGLGCVKFSAELIARHPEMFDEIGTWSNASHPPKHWCTLDAWIYHYLIGRGERRCENHESVGHIGHPGKGSSSHGCVSI